MSSPFDDQPFEHGACAMPRVETFSGLKHMVMGNSEDDGIDLLSEVGGLSYGTYLRLDKILSAQEMVSAKNGKPVHDEHLFIVVHQTYELWFKQIIFEIDSVREIFMGSERSQMVKEFGAQTMSAPIMATSYKERSSEPNRSRADFALPDSPVDESKMLEIISRMNRVVKILKVMVDQVTILETMTPLSFMDFRNYLGASSGFQSLQFRLLENKLGIKPENRVKYNQSNYRNVFNNSPNELATLECSETEPSLSEYLQKWLERTPGLEPEGFNFPAKFQRAVEKVFEEEREAIAKDENSVSREYKTAQLNKRKAHFDSLLNEEIHNKLLARGERRFTLKALQGALMISLYSEEPRFHQPHHLLMLLMDIDALITKWRYNHVLLVQRMLGSQQMGSGGSSGYQYLRSTLSERYKIFLDLFNMSSFLIPRDEIPPLTPDMKTMLRTHSHDGSL